MTLEEHDALIRLGGVIRHGMDRVDMTDRFTGSDDITNTYQVAYQMPDMRVWEITVRRKR